MTRPAIYAPETIAELHRMADAGRNAREIADALNMPLELAAYLSHLSVEAARVVAARGKA